MPLHTYFVTGYGIYNPDGSARTYDITGGWAIGTLPIWACVNPNPQNDR